MARITVDVLEPGSPVIVIKGLTRDEQSQMYAWTEEYLPVGSPAGTVEALAAVGNDVHITLTAQQHSSDGMLVGFVRSALVNAGLGAELSPNPHI